MDCRSFFPIYHLLNFFLKKAIFVQKEHEDLEISTKMLKIEAKMQYLASIFKKLFSFNLSVSFNFSVRFPLLHNEKYVTKILLLFRNHSSEIRSFCLSFCPSKMLQNLLYFIYKKTKICFIHFSFCATLYFSLMNALVSMLT